MHAPETPYRVGTSSGLAAFRNPRRCPAYSHASARQTRRWSPESAADRARYCGSPRRQATAAEHGYERFPYLPQALTDLGLMPPFRSPRLWAFFDSSYRSRVDLDYFAARWRAAGIGALHVAAWHYWERDPEDDEYLRHLIEACHRNAILVYAWLELPHVSEKFWDRSSGVAREDRAAAGRPARLAQADEPHQPRRLRGGRRRACAT